MLDCEKDVREMYDVQKNEGILVGQEPRKMKNSFGFYFSFDKIMIEIGHCLN